MTAQNYTINKMTVLNQGESKLGNQLLAAFDIASPEIKMIGCALLKLSSGKIVASGPAGKNSAGHKVRVHFNSTDFAEQITEKALDAYAALTGSDPDD